MSGRILRIQPLTAASWPDLETLFGSRGACGGCWCMHWRQTSREYEAGKGEANRRALRELAADGASPGLLGYDSSGPVGWVSVGPRSGFPRLDRSRILKPVDAQPVWSIVCLFVDRRARRQGVSRLLIEAAAVYAGRQGAGIVEAYPVEPRQESMPDVFAFTGLAAAFRAAGFTEVARRSETRPIMRRVLPAGN